MTTKLFSQVTVSVNHKPIFGWIYTHFDRYHLTTELAWFTYCFMDFTRFSQTGLNFTSQVAFTCSKLTIETLEQRCEICSKLSIKTTERRRRSGVFNVNFEHISHLVPVFLWLTLNMKLLAGLELVTLMNVFKKRNHPKVFINNCFLLITSMDIRKIYQLCQRNFCF